MMTVLVAMLLIAATLAIMALPALAVGNGKPCADYTVRGYHPYHGDQDYCVTGSGRA
jgi:hypothetical protein